jgi:hypothetical protein
MRDTPCIAARNSAGVALVAFDSITIVETDAAAYGSTPCRTAFG